MQVANTAIATCPTAHNNYPVCGAINPMSPSPCSECGTRLSSQAETCPDCGYPATPHYLIHGDVAEVARSMHKEYRLIQMLGGGVVAIGLAAALLDSPIAAAVSIAIGVATYLTGLLGSWWNRGD